MTLASSGTLTLNDIQGEFGGSNPIGLNEYYRGGSLVPNHSNTSSIPTSGTIQVDDFYGTSSASPLDLSFTMTVGDANVTQGKFVFRFFGYANTGTPVVLGNVGSISDNSVASGGTSGTITGSYQQHYSGWPNASVVGGFAHTINFSSNAIRDAIFTGRSGANFQGLGNENWQTGNNALNTGLVNPTSGTDKIYWGKGFGSGTDATELARYNRFAAWINGRVGSSTTVTFY